MKMLRFGRYLNYHCNRLEFEVEEEKTEGTPKAGGKSKAGKEYDDSQFYLEKSLYPDKYQYTPAVSRYIQKQQLKYFLEHLMEFKDFVASKNDGTMEFYGFVSDLSDPELAMVDFR